MNILQFLKGAAVSLACWGVVFPQSQVWAENAVAPKTAAALPVAKETVELIPVSENAETDKTETDKTETDKSTSTPKIKDVELAEGGTLAGRVFSLSGKPIKNAKITLRQGAAKIAVVQSDENGVFTATNLRGGLYHVQCGCSNQLYRAWAPETAPPAANSNVVLVTNEQVVRAQHSCPYCEDEGCEYCNGEDHVYHCEEEEHVGVDIFTIALITTSIAALTVGIIALTDDDDDDRPASP